MREALGRQWLKAIDIALAAVEAAARAGAMPADEAAGYRRLLAPERAWVEAFDWSTLDRRASVVVLARRRSPRDNVEKAA